MFEECLPLKPMGDGTYVFFPNGTLSKKGYILTQSEADWVRNFIIAYYSISMSVLTIGIFALHKYLATILFGLVISFGYYIKIRKFIKNKPQIEEKIKPFENIKNMSWKTFILMIIGALGSLFFVILSLIIMIKMDKKPSWEGIGFLLFSLLLFALFLLIVMIKIKEAKKRHKARTKGSDLHFRN